MTARAALYLLLAVVSTAAAVLSFAALRDLAVLCGFSRGLAWLLPVVVDAGAAAGTLVWMGGRMPDPARRFAKRLARTLLGTSVVANALSHGAAARAAGLAWWVVVVACVVSGMAPAVLGTVIHLAVLVSRGSRTPGADLNAPHDVPADVPPVSRDDQQESDCPPADVPPDVPASPADGGDRVMQLIEAGAGRRRLSRELGLTEHEARELLAKRRNGTSG